MIQLVEDAPFSLKDLRAYLQKWGSQPSSNGAVLEQVIAINSAGDIVVLWP